MELPINAAVLYLFDFKRLYVTVRTAATHPTN